MTVYLQDADLTVHHGDALETLRTLPDESVHMCVTSPPFYQQRDYQVDGQIGLEESPQAWVDALVAVFREVRRVLRSDGTLWVEVGDSYNANQGAGFNANHHRPREYARRVDANLATGTRRIEGVKPKDLVGAPWLLAFALRTDGWYLRSDIIWARPNPMPESATDRPTKSHSYLFLLAKSARYFYDADAIREPAEWARWGDQTVPKHEGTATTAGWIKPKTKQELTGEQRAKGGDRWSRFNDRWDAAAADGSAPRARNKRSVWTIPTEPLPDQHYAAYPQALVEPCILAGSPEGGVVLDPFLGSGTTALVARRLGRRCVGIELSADYCTIIARRTQQLSLLGGETP